MNKLISIVGITIALTHSVLASGNRSIFLDSQGNGIDNATLREGNVHIGDIPNAGLAIINNLLSFVGSFALLFLLIGALVYVFGGISDKAKQFGKTAINMAIVGCIIAWSAWFIVNFIIDNLG